MIEDNEQVGAFSTQMLEELGFEITWVTNANAALQLPAENPGRYAAVFSNVVMPGMNRVGLDWGVSIRRACRVLEMDTSTYQYKFRRREQAGIEAKIGEICETRVRYGYRRVHVLLRRGGWEINMKRTHRIYNELSLQLRNKTLRQRVKAKLRDDRCAASRVNDVWAMDFVHGQLATGRKIRVLTVVDTFSRFSPVLD